MELAQECLDIASTMCKEGWDTEITPHEAAIITALSTLAIALFNRWEN